MLNTINLIIKNKNFKREDDIFFKISKEVIYIYSPIEKIEIFLKKKNLEIENLEIENLKELSVFLYKETDLIYEVYINSKNFTLFFKNKSILHLRDYIINIMEEEKENPSHIEIYLIMKNTLIRDERKFI
jgi:hypothetical protein